MSSSRLICGLMAAGVLLGQGVSRPRFDRDHVVPLHSYVPKLLTRGQFVSINGWGLLPTAWCGEPHVQQAPFPPELCGVRVLVGGHPAGLMYVGPTGNPNMHADQINFQVPGDAPAEGMVPIRVCVVAVCSDPVEMEFTAKDIVLRVQGNALAHMPVWIHVEIPMNVDFSYPYGDCPWDFGGYQFEIRQNGQPVTPDSKPECIHKLKNRLWIAELSNLPLHLVHRFDNPGTYEFRLTGPLFTPDLTKVARTGHSDWTQVIVQPQSEEERDAWLRDIEKKADESGEWQRYGDSIASLLAWPDENALAVLLHFLPPSPQTSAPGRLNVNLEIREQAKRCAVSNALAGFPETVLQKFISAARLKELRTAAMWCP